MADQTVRDVLLRVSLEYVKTEPKIETDKAKKKLDEIRSAAEKAQKEMEAALKAVEEQGRKSTEQTIAVGENLKSAGDGAFTLARGVAFLATSTDEDFAKVIKNVAKVQGAFDLFKGGVEVISGASKALAAYRAASEAAAAADAARAVATTAASVAADTTAVAATEATLAMRAMTVATGPLGIVLAGLAAAGGAAYYDLVQAPKQAAEEEKKYQEVLRNTIRRVKDVIRENEKRKQAEQNAAQVEILRAKGRTRQGIGDPGKQDQDIGRALDESARRLEQLRQQYAELPVFEREARIAISEQIDEETQQFIRLNELKNENYQRELDNLDKVLGNLEKQRDLAQEQLDKERERLGVAAEIGRLTESQRAELDALAKKKEEGGLTNDELKRLEQLAPSIVRDFTQGEFAKQGEEQAGRLQQQFQVEDTAAERAVQDAQRKVDEMRQFIETAGSDVADTIKEGWEQIVEMLEGLVPLHDEIRDIRRELMVRQAGRN